MNRAAYILAGWIMVALLFFNLPACYLDDASPDPIQPLPYLQIEGLLDSLKLAAPASVYTVDVSTATSFVGAGGTKINIPKDAFKDDSGNPITGVVEIMLNEVLTKPQFVLNNMPTTSNGKLLESGGALHISATQNGKVLSLAKPLVAELKVSSAVSQTSGMEVFYSDNNLDTINWQVTNDGSYVEYDPSSMPPVFRMSFKELTYINCDYFLGSSIPTTPITIEPSGYSTKLTDGAGYLVFKNLNAIMRMKFQDAKLLTSRVPIGEEAIVVILAMDRRILYYGSKTITISSNLSEQVNIDISSQDEIHEAILNLY